MPELSIELIIASLGYVGIFLLMIANGAVSFPSSQILYIVAGYFVFTGNLSLPLVVLFGAAGNTIGNILLYEAARAKGYEYIVRFTMFPESAVKKARIAFAKRGAWFAFIGKLLPAIKVFVPIPAGISEMNRGLFAALMFAGSVIWTFPFIGIGYYFGKSADVFGAYGAVLLVIAIFLVVVFYKYMNSHEVLTRLDDSGAKERPERETGMSDDRR